MGFGVRGMLFLGLVAAMNSGSSVALAEDFRSYILDVAYDSKTGELVDATDYHNPKVIAVNPQIERRETPIGLVFTFSSKGRQILKILRGFPIGRDTRAAFIASIEYKGKVSTALGHLSLQVAPRSKKELCALAKDLGNFQRMLKTQTNRVYSDNMGGLGSKGVCWWNSRFERKAAYLTFYRPDLPKPSKEKGRYLIGLIRAGKFIVEIPGYENLSEFTKDFAEDFQDSMNHWQISDGIFGGGFVNGLVGSTETRPESFKKIMDETYENVISQKKIAFHILQMPGLDAHAWLVLGMRKTDDGYQMQVADSNDTSVTSLVNYRYGMTQLDYIDEGESTLSFVPYLPKAYVNEGDRTIQTLRKGCRN